MTSIGVDAGGSATRATLFSAAGRKLLSVSGKAANPHSVGFDASAAEICALILQILRTAPKPPQLVALCLSGGECAQLRQRYRAYIENVVRGYCSDTVFDTCVLVMQDAVGPAGLLLEYGPCENSETVGLVSLIGGTGSVAAGFSMRRAGGVKGRVGCEVREWGKCGGRGPIVGDEGSGYWIATGVLRRALCIWDGLGTKILDDCKDRGMAEEILRAACEAWLGWTGGMSEDVVERLVAYIHKGSTLRGDVASLTEVFGGLASRGNEICREVFSAAGRHLAELLLTVANRLLLAVEENVVRVDAVAAGGVFRCWDDVPSFSRGFLDEVGPQLHAGKRIRIMLLRNHAGDLEFACARFARMTLGFKESESWGTSADHMLRSIT